MFSLTFTRRRSRLPTSCVHTRRPLPWSDEMNLRPVLRPTLRLTTLRPVPLRRVPHRLGPLRPVPLRLLPLRLLALSAVVLPIALAACGRVPGQFEILNEQVPTSSGGGCTIPVNPTVYQGQGTLDISIVRDDFESAYFMFPLIENNLPKSVSSSSVDPNEIQLSGFQVDIAPLAGTQPPASVQAVFASAGALTHYQVPWSGGISSGGGRLSAFAAAFPVALAQKLLATGAVDAGPSLTIDLTLQALGTTNSGTHMESDPFHFPVVVCTGCLVATTPLLPCPDSAAPAHEGNGCNPAQDVPVDCCTESGALVCPPTVAAQ
jgi:hypothetical protein